MEYWESEIKLSDLMNKGIISLGRGRIISSIDLQKKPGVYPVYSSSSQKGGLFGLYDEFDFDEELLTWSVDGGGHFFYRPKHKFSVTNVSGILKINEPIFDYKFLYYSLVYQHSKEVFDYVDKAHPSVIKKRYNVPNISINEQKKIAEILTKVDEAIENTVQLIQKYERVKVGLMQDLLTKGIDENGNVRSEETHQFKDSPLGRIPVEWEVDNLGNISVLKSGATPLRSNSKFWNDNIPWVKTGEINYNIIDKTEENISYEGLIKSSCFLIPKNTILMAMYGQGKTRGRVAITGIECACNQACVAFLEIKNIKVKLLYYILSNNYLNLRDLSNDGAQNNLSSTILKKFKIRFPLSENEQIKIINKLENIDYVINRSFLTLEKYKKQKQGLMQDLLSGKIRVNY
jgi:type I restriction enzyme S subunit